MPTTEKRPLKVFLCHSSTDKPKVRELYRYLKRRGINPWFDEEHLVGGQDWQVEIPKALATSDAIIICLTKNSVDKEGYIQKEIKFALDKALEMPEGRIFLIPVKFEECEVPFTLSRYQWVDLTIESGYAKMMKALKFRAAQLERSTVEVSKKGVEEENLAREKEEQREATEKIQQEKTRQELERGLKKISNDSKRRIQKIEWQYRWEKFVGAIRYRLKLFRIYRTPILILLVMFAIVTPLIIDLSNRIPELIQSLIATPPTTSVPLILSKSPDTVELTNTPLPISSSSPSEIFTLTATPLLTEITDPKGVPMVLIPEGEFTMGVDTPNAYYIGSDAPTRNVFLDAFYIDKYEATIENYKVCVSAGECSSPQTKSSAYRANYYDNPEYGNYPVIYVDWNMAKGFCEWRTANLPTEAQWEKAARGEDGQAYPWGFERTYPIVCSKARFSGCWVDTSAVGSYEEGKSPYGIYDMLGNVQEWIADWYSPNYYENAPYKNPLGPTSGSMRVVRDSGWYNEHINPFDLTPIYIRYYLKPTDANFYTGLRCAKDAP